MQDIAMGVAARNFSEALVSCAVLRVPLVEWPGSTHLRAWACRHARPRSHEACPSEEIDRLYFFETRRDGLIVAHSPPRGAVHQTPIGFVRRLSPRGSPARVRMAAFVRIVVIQIKGLRRSVPRASTRHARRATKRFLPCARNLATRRSCPNRTPWGALPPPAFTSRTWSACRRAPSKHALDFLSVMRILLAQRRQARTRSSPELPRRKLRFGRRRGSAFATKNMHACAYQRR